MKNKNYQESALKKQLRQKEYNGVKILKWSLTPSKKELIESFGYYVEPYLYQINTRKFYNINKINNKLLKELHYLNKKGKRYKTCNLTENEKRLLDSFEIRYKPIKYIIYLKRK